MPHRVFEQLGGDLTAALVSSRPNPLKTTTFVPPPSLQGPWTCLALVFTILKGQPGFESGVRSWIKSKVLSPTYSKLVFRPGSPTRAFGECL